jgi:hypothetical protein
MTTERTAAGAADPVTLEVPRNGLYSVSDEMVRAHPRRYRTNIKVTADCSCGIYTSDGDVIAMSEFKGHHCIWNDAPGRPDGVRLVAARHPRAG